MMDLPLWFAIPIGVTLSAIGLFSALALAIRLSDILDYRSSYIKAQAEILDLKREVQRLRNRINK